MIPSSIGAAVGFLLLLAPGVAWELISGRFRSAVKETALTELSRIVLASTVATSAAGLLFLDQWFELVLSDQALAASEGVLTRNIITMSLWTALVACGLVVVTGVFVWLVRWRKAGRVRRGRTWSLMFDDYKPARTEHALVSIELMDGSGWRGQVQAFDDDPEDTGRWITLSRPIGRRPPAQDGFSAVHDRWQFVAVREPDIRSIRVCYPDATSDQDGRWVKLRHSLTSLIKRISARRQQ